MITRTRAEIKQEIRQWESSLNMSRERLQELQDELLALPDPPAEPKTADLITYRTGTRQRAAFRHPRGTSATGQRWELSTDLEGDQLHTWAEVLERIGEENWSTIRRPTDWTTLSPSQGDETPSPSPDAGALPRFVVGEVTVTGGGGSGLSQSAYAGPSVITIPNVSPDLPSPWREALHFPPVGEDDGGDEDWDAP